MHILCVWSRLCKLCTVQTHMYIYKLTDETRYTNENAWWMDMLIELMSRGMHHNGSDIFIMVLFQYIYIYLFTYTSIKIVNAVAFNCSANISDYDHEN